ncbi:MAG: YihY/virulence factor BrkB family protein [Nitrospirota bacterium]
MSLRSGVVLAGGILRVAVRKFAQVNGLFLASGLAFSLILYAIPLALIMISLLGYTVLGSAQAMSEVESVIRRFLPRSQQAFAENVASIVANRGLLGAAGFVSFLVFSTTVFGSIRFVLNIVFEAGPGRSFLGGIARDLLMLAFCVALVLIAIVAGWLLDQVRAAGDHLPWLAPLWEFVVRAVRTLLALALAGGLIYGLYRFSPAKTLSPDALAVGSLAALALFEVARRSFAWYIEFAQSSIALYGALSGLVFLFFWLYYASAVFVLGAAAGWAYEHMKRADSGSIATPALGLAMIAIMPHLGDWIRKALR